MSPPVAQPPATTVGEVRRALEKMGTPWQVDPRLSDDEPIPNRPRGGQLDADVPEQHRLTPLDASVDLTKIIKSNVPLNPFLRARWIEAGLCETRDALPLPNEDDDRRWGAS